MRHFLSDPLDPALLDRLLAAAHLAPSVGLMQPWRFIRVRDRGLRERIHGLVEGERAADRRRARRARRRVHAPQGRRNPRVRRTAWSQGWLPDAKSTCSDAARCPRWIWRRWPARSRTCGSRRAPKGSAWAGCRCSSRDAARTAAHAGGRRPVAVLCLGHVASSIRGRCSKWRNGLAAAASLHWCTPTTGRRAAALRTAPAVDRVSVLRQRKSTR